MPVILPSLDPPSSLRALHYCDVPSEAKQKRDWTDICIDTMLAAVEDIAPKNVSEGSKTRQAFSSSRL
ncbi:hypothetical protein CHU98_g1317 [Xylaria longipes]|nr:hypothetical protein CHU98_g1317 [Xylaria longipes]